MVSPSVCSLLSPFPLPRSLPCILWEAFCPFHYKSPSTVGPHSVLGLKNTGKPQTWAVQTQQQLFPCKMGRESHALHACIWSPPHYNFPNVSVQEEQRVFTFSLSLKSLLSSHQISWQHKSHLDIHEEEGTWKVPSWNFLWRRQNWVAPSPWALRQPPGEEMEKNFQFQAGL